MKTIKQIADKIGVDKQKVYRYIRKNHINEAHQKSGVMHFNDAVVMQIVRHFISSEAGYKGDEAVYQTTSSSASLDAVIDALTSELEIKNEQIRELNARLTECNAALVAAQQSAQAAQVLHAGTMQKHLIDGEAIKEEPARRVNLLSRLFRRR